MSLTIISINAIALLIAAFVYRHFGKKAETARFFYPGLAFIGLEILLYGIALHYMDQPLRSFFDIRYGEYNHSSAFSSLLLFISAITAFSYCFNKQNSLEQLYFLFLSLCFVFLAFVEYFMIHETLPNWTMSYVVVALAMAGAGAFAFLRIKPQYGLFIYLLLFGGMALSAMGSVVVEEFFGKSCFGLLNSLDCSEIPLLEEILETLGFLFAATGLMLLQSSEKNRRFIGLLSGMWLVFLLFSTWLQPMLESQFLAQKTSVQFEDSPITLSAYRLNAESFRVGEVVSLDLYWQSSSNLNNDYGYTINLLDPVTGESLWRENLNIAYPATKGWFTGVTYRSHYDFVIPETIETPVVMIFTVGLWTYSGGTYQNFGALSEELPIFAEEFPVLASIPLLSSGTAFTAAYRFANGILLAEPELIRENERQYLLNLHWSSEANINESLGYFIHFLGENDNLILDRQPFESRFPSTAWRLGMSEVDEIVLELPENATGSYRVQIGLFDGINRLAVNDMAGNAIPEDSIPLGRVTVR